MVVETGLRAGVEEGALRRGVAPFPVRSANLLVDRGGALSGRFGCVVRRGRRVVVGLEFKGEGLDMRMVSTTVDEDDGGKDYKDDSAPDGATDNSTQRNCRSTLSCGRGLRGRRGCL